MSQREAQSTLSLKWKELKEQHPEAILLFRIGDYCEALGEDADRLSEILGVARTVYGDSMSVAGFPYHSLDLHLKKLVAAGHRVVVAEPVTNNQKGECSVDRDIST